VADGRGIGASCTTREPCDSPRSDISGEGMRMRGSHFHIKATCTSSEIATAIQMVGMVTPSRRLRLSSSQLVIACSWWGGAAGVGRAAAGEGRIISCDACSNRR
jgi:hypothetical protein